MLTLSVIKENPEEVIRRLAIKHFDGKEAINRVLELDKIRRASQAELDGKLAELKVLAAQTGQLMKAGKKEEAEAVKMKTGKDRRSDSRTSRRCASALGFGQEIRFNRFRVGCEDYRCRIPCV